MLETVPWSGCRPAPKRTRPAAKAAVGRHAARPHRTNSKRRHMWRCRRPLVRQYCGQVLTAQELAVGYGTEVRDTRNETAPARLASGAVRSGPPFRLLVDEACDETAQCVVRRLKGLRVVRMLRL